MRSHIAPEHSPASKPLSCPQSIKGAEEPHAGPLAVYVHWPYCQSKCPYCDFNSHVRRSISEEQFVAAAVWELRHYASQTRGRPVASVFFGGGTPSLMLPQSVGLLLDEIAALWRMQDGCEITLEANPSSVEAQRFAGYRLAGVNRISVGVQSFDEDALRFLGRLHSAAEARQALEIAQRYFDRMSFDLIYARPDQSVGSWRAELASALGLAHGHLSLYQLTIERETAFFDLERRGKLKVPDRELAAGLYELTQEMCEAAGLPAYEISNHAAPGFESRHNLNYWRYGDYAGVGPGAHGRITVGGRKYATAACKTPADWHAKVLNLGHGCEESVELARKEQAEEMVLTGLRLKEGLDLAKLAQRTGFQPNESQIAPLHEEGLVLSEGGSLRVSDAGRLVLNAIVQTIALSLEERRPPSVLSDGRAE